MLGVDRQKLKHTMSTINFSGLVCLVWYLSEAKPVKSSRFSTNDCGNDFLNKDHIYSSESLSPSAFDSVA